MFESLPETPDHPHIEGSILAMWDREQIFEQLRSKNADGPRFSFIDGPVTANKDLGVHTAWGRTLKDVFQRYKAMRGFHQRYQNGFDCQGLWIEVGVERELGLNSKREIEDYGLEAFARRCREVVEWSSQKLTEGSVRLGQWMDWDRSYFTFSDTNIEYIWKFLKLIQERGWLYRGHRATEWCPRCGTSISAHELAGNYIDRQDPALTVRFPLVDRPGESVVVWTTTPWTLPANVAAAVRPDATYGLRSGEWMAVERAGDGTFEATLLGHDMVGWPYVGPFDELGPGGRVDHRVIPWDEVSLDEGTGIVHIAPGCGAEDFSLAGELGLDVLTPVDEAGRFYPEYGWLSGQGTGDAARPIIETLRRRDLLSAESVITHRYPECWRCHTGLIFRISDDWFIAVAEIREPLRAANRSVNWIPAYMGKRMDDWLVNMGDWNISRRRYYGLPLPIYPCACGEVHVIGSKAELAERATGPLDGLVELHRPWIDAIRIRCDRCGSEVERIPDVGDVWLDAGIVPFSTLGWENPEWVLEGGATGAARGLTLADLPDHRYWEEWFPADWISEMREQIRLWFYAQLFMSVAITGRAPFRTVLGYEKMLDERGREMHGSWGNTISADEAFAEMGADVMRWQYCMQPPSQNLLFGFGPGHEIKRKLITLWNSVSFFVRYANLVEFRPDPAVLTRPAGEPGPGEHVEEFDRWLMARTAKFVADATEGYEQFLTVNVLRTFEEFLDDLSNWYIRRTRRRFWEGDEAALRTLWATLVQVLRVLAPVMPFLTEFLWSVLVHAPCEGAPRSVFLAGWPGAAGIDAELLADQAAVRGAVELGRQARAGAGIKVRQPLRRMLIGGADRVGRSLELIAQELRVKEVGLGHIDAELHVRPNLPVLGPRLGPKLPALRQALAAGQYELLPDGGLQVGDMALSADEVLIERRSLDGWAVASSDGITVALDVALDDDLLLEGRVNDLVHHVNRLRKETGLEITDRIELAIPESDYDLMGYRDWIMAETLAVALHVGPGDDIRIEKVAP